jgi:hypothetical protein
MATFYRNIACVTKALGNSRKICLITLKLINSKKTLLVFDEMNLNILITITGKTKDEKGKTNNGFHFKYFFFDEIVTGSDE